MTGASSQAGLDDTEGAADRAIELDESGVELDGAGRGKPEGAKKLGIAWNSDISSDRWG